MNAFTGDPLYLIVMLSLVVVGSEWLCRRWHFRHIGSALMVILLGALLANIGAIPAGSTELAPVPVYDAIFAYVAPVSIFWLLLSVNLRDVIKVGLPLLMLFLVGAAGTFLGALIGFRLVGGTSVLGPLGNAVTGMFVGTYTGGSVNFNAVALQFDVVREGVLYGGTIVVDNIITTFWIIVTLLVPRVLSVAWRRRAGTPLAGTTVPIVELAAEQETVNPATLAAVLALGVGALLVALRLSRLLADVGFAIPPILLITAFALVLAQFRVVNRLAGARALAMFAVYLFLTVIGAFCDLRALPQLGSIGVALFGLALCTVIVHGAFVSSVAWTFRLDLDAAAVASQANVGGATSALALAKSLGREDLLVPGILLGSLGTAIGTFLGFLAVRFAT
jgi:uncharacterized membrane protein